MSEKTLHYLTIQDIIWINSVVSQKVNLFNYAKLEEATFAQYSYGRSTNFFRQAVQFLETFCKVRPFAQANEATAFVSFVTFLKINGAEMKVMDENTEELFQKLIQDTTKDEGVLEENIIREDSHDELTINQTVYKVLEKFPSTITQLTQKAAYVGSI